MTETTTMTQTDLDRLTERVEKAAGIVQQLRDDRTRLEQERNTLMGRLQDLEHKLQGSDAGELVQEVMQLRKEQRDWQAERRDVASRIEDMVLKLERLEG
jgi:FtsZ-binding cell division protein ZapB